MTSASAFGLAARSAILEASGHACVGCGRQDSLNAQHRRARGMGGSRNPELGQAPNGVMLCGSGTLGCHGWAEHHPTEAELLGWRLSSGSEAVGSPWWHRSYGWVAWMLDDGDPMVRWVMEEDLDRPAEREDALCEFRRHLSTVVGNPVGRQAPLPLESV
jgi:hypothetical protein